MQDRPLIPPELVKTRLDQRVNRAYELARKHGCRQYVWQPGDGSDPVLITNWRPTDDACVMVDPRGFAVMLAPDSEEV